MALSQTAKRAGGEVDEEDLAGGKYAHLSTVFVRKDNLGRRFRKEMMEYERGMGSLDVEDDGWAEDRGVETGGREGDVGIGSGG